MDFNPTIAKILIALFSVISLAMLRLRTVGSREKDLPPGPKTAPILGNVLDFPPAFPHLKFSEWARDYGDIFSLKIFNQTMIVISSASAVKHILDNNGANTGGRAPSVIMHRITNGEFMALENMKTRVWKQTRRAIRTFLTQQSLDTQSQLQHVESSQLMYDILGDPKNLYQHIRRATASVMTTSLYGIRASEYQGSYAEAHYKVIKLFSESADPGAHPPVDLFWPLQYVPKRWAYWKRLTDKTRRLRNELYGSLYEECKRAIERDNLTGCYIESVILNQHELGMTPLEIINLGAVLMDGGAETSASFLQSFILALINNPNVQERAQEEIDRVVGSDRCPELDDFDRLPYIRAIVDEVFRIRTIFPVGIPHLCTKVVQYKGFCIPKDAIIFMNIHGIFNDPDMYADPEKFQPERFLKTPFGIKEGANADGHRRNFTFGAGMRVCPGEAVARRTITINVMNLLWAFNFKKDKSGSGGQDWDSYVKVVKAWDRTRSETVYMRIFASICIKSGKDQREVLKHCPALKNKSLNPPTS